MNDPSLEVCVVSVLGNRKLSFEMYGKMIVDESTMRGQ
jgi:hypothetical protein